MTDDPLKPIAEAVSIAIEGAGAPGRAAIQRAYAEAKVIKEMPADAAPDATASPTAKPKGARKGKSKPQSGGGGDGREPIVDDDFVERLNQDYAFIIIGGRPAVVKKNTTGPIADRIQFLRLEAFQKWFGNSFVEIRGADGKKKVVSVGMAWLANRGRRSYEGVEFHPDPNNKPGDPRLYNLWCGFAIKPVEKSGSYAIFRDHLLVNVCQGDDILFHWIFAFFAHIVQRPRERIGVALVLCGKMGCGKSIVGEVFGSLFPAHYYPVDDPRYVTGNFNAHMGTCLLICADEAVWAGDKTAEGRLKGLITSTEQMIELKGIDSVKLPNYVRVVMTSNEAWVVPAGREERRFAVLNVDPRCVGNYGYFKEMIAELDNGGREALLYDLLHFDLDSVALRTIPKTRALLDQKERSLDSIKSWWLGRLNSGCITRHANGWERSISRDVLFEDYLNVSDRIGVKRRQEETIFGKELRELVPNLGTTRPWQTIDRSAAPPERKRVRCYEISLLAVCRAAWDEAMGQSRDWPPEDEAGIGASESGDGGEF